MTSITKLQKEVISVGLCTACGTCVSVCPNRGITFNYETEEPETIRECPPHCNLCYESCPGKDVPLPELEQVTFGRKRRGGDEELLGINQGYLKGHANDGGVREYGASGGVASALLIYAVETGLVDAAIVAGMDERRPWRVVPKIATTRSEIVAASQSKIVLVPTNSVLNEALQMGLKRLAVVGLPCHVHAIRKMALHNRPRKLVQSIRLVVGLFCGNNWSYRGTEHVIEEVCGVPLSQVAKLEYRGGPYPGSFTVTAKDGRIVAISSAARRLHSWRFEADRCAVCYDNANDLADVSIGDYLEPEVKVGSPGWSALIVRTNNGRSLVEAAQKTGYVTFESITRDNFFASPFCWKKHGAPYHLMERKRHGWPTPDYHIPLDYQKPLMPFPVDLITRLGHPHHRTAH